MEYFQAGATTLPGRRSGGGRRRPAWPRQSACEMNAAGTPSVARLMTTSHQERCCER